MKPKGFVGLLMRKAEWRWKFRKGKFELPNEYESR